MVICFSVAFIAVTPKPALADDSQPVGLILGISCTIGLIAVLIIVNSTDQDAAKKQMQVRQQKSDRETKFNARVGKWIYDDMLTEMGAPSNVTEGDKIKIAVYDTTKTSTTGKTVYHKGDFLSEATFDTSSTDVKAGRYILFLLIKKQAN
jgi:hypothetical protein